MDDILRRMMDVERQAAQTVAAAEAEALRLLDAGRQEAAVEAQRLKSELAAEVRRLIDGEVAVAERVKADALRRAETRLQARATAFAQALATRQQRATEELAYPLESRGT